MITQDTAATIWECHREIAASEKLLADIAKERAESNDRFEKGFEPKLTDVFGHRRDLQLGVPSRENDPRLLRVAPDLAKSVIRARSANMQAKRSTANEQARIELNTKGPANVQ